MTLINIRLFYKEELAKSDNVTTTCSILAIRVRDGARCRRTLECIFLFRASILRHSRSASAQLAQSLSKQGKSGLDNELTLLPVARELWP